MLKIFNLVVIKFSLIILIVGCSNNKKIKEIKSDRDRYIKYQHAPKDYSRYKEFNNSLIINP